MDVSIIGPGNMGRGLARLLVEQGMGVVVAHKDIAKARTVAGELGGGAQAMEIGDAVKASYIVILAVPYGSAAVALAAAGDVTGKTVIDITNPLTPDYSALTIGHTTSAAEEIAKLATGAHVVKAFNTVFWQALPFEVRRGKPPVQVLLAADDAAAKQAASDLCTALEFEPVDAGPLTNSRYIEPVAEMNIQLGYMLGWGTLIAPAWVRF